MLLRLKDVRVHYGKAEAIQGITVDMEEGSITGLIGANGAGKSTVLKAISGLHPDNRRRSVVQRQENRRDSGP